MKMRASRRFSERWQARRCKNIIVFWLILPVVICLSQRLSHACLSKPNNGEAANGSLQQPLFTWIYFLLG